MIIAANEIVARNIVRDLPAKTKWFKVVDADDNKIDVAGTREKAQELAELIPGACGVAAELYTQREMLQRATRFVVTDEAGSYFAGRGKWVDNVEDARIYDEASKARRAAEYYARKNRGHGYPLKRVWLFDD